MPAAELWFTIRKLRNHMVHEYIEDATLLAGVLQSGHSYVPLLCDTAEKFVEAIKSRKWLE
jgi:hypothetical protein